MAEIAAQVIDQAAGTEVTFTAASATGDTFQNNHRTTLALRNKDTQNTKVITITKTRPSVETPGFGTIALANITVTLGPATAAVPKLKHVPVPTGSHGERPVLSYDSASGVELGVSRLPSSL